MTTSTKKPVILCVDDEKMILDSLNRQLQRHFKEHYEFEFAESGEEAISLIGELAREGQTVVMVISDQIMPGMTGDQFLIKVHSDHPKPIKLLLTGQASLDSAIKAINNANLYRYITKPWMEEDFMLTVQKGLEQYYLLEKTQQQVDMFSRFVPKEFLESFSKKSILEIQLGDHVQKEMTVLFANIKNFTSMTDNLTPEEIYVFINKYLGYVEPTVHNFSGFIDKYIGDTIMALFDDPQKAFLASLELQRVVKQFNDEHHDEKFGSIESEIGLHYGNLMLGVVGVKNRMQSTVISDAVNIASRMEDIAGKIGAGIIASSNFIQRLEMVNDQEVLNYTRFLGKIYVKGKKQFIPVYEIISFDADPLAKQKMDTKRNFEEGIALFFNKNFAEACVKFKEVLKEMPADKISLQYLNLAADYMISGPPKDLEGIHIS